MKFKVWEDQLTLIAEDISNIDEAVKIAKIHHGAFPNKYHEVYKVCGPFCSWGCHQLKPGDDINGFPMSEVNRTPKETAITEVENNG